MSTYQEWQHKYQATKPYPDYGPRHLIRVTAGLHYVSGNSLPYFSVGADIYRPGGRDIEAGGCLHREVLSLWPDLAPIVALHLSDSNGVPMHAMANGWYQLAGYYGGADERYHGGNSERQHWNADGSFNGYRLSTPDECLESFADHVRLPLEEARALAIGWEYREDWASTKRWYVQWVETQRARWQTEADAARALLDTLIARDAVVGAR